MVIVCVLEVGDLDEGCVSSKIALKGGTKGKNGENRVDWQGTGRKVGRKGNGIREPERRRLKEDARKLSQGRIKRGDWSRTCMNTEWRKAMINRRTKYNER